MICIYLAAEVAKILTLKLTLPVPMLEEEKKINFFSLLFGVSKDFMNALKVFIKPFEAPQRSIKTRI